jgi:hypothetical protein
MQDAEYADKMREINEVLRSEAAGRPWVRYVDVWDASSGPNGEYKETATDDDGTQRVLRDDDGIHLTPYGGEILARVVMDQIFDD